MFPAEISWTHAKKKEGQSQNGHVEQSGQKPLTQNHEKGSCDQTSEAEIISRCFEVLLKGQSDQLECLSRIQATLSAMSESLKVLSEWANYDASKREEAEKERCSQAS